MKSNMWIYPWDVIDVGLEDALDDLLQRAHLDGVSLATAYHAGHFLQPRSPRRHVYFPEDGTLYFNPDWRRYERLKLQPRVARLVEEQGDTLAALSRARERKGFKLNGWTVCLHNSRLGAAHPEVCTENAYGDRSIYNLCPSNPDARAYLTTVVSDLTEHYDIDSVELESPNFMPFTHQYHHEKDGVGLTARDDFLISLCFCPSCLRRAEEAGVDGDGARRTTIELLDGVLSRPVPEEQPTFIDDGPSHFEAYPELAAYVKWRNAPVTSLVREVRNHVNNATRVHFLSLQTKRAWLYGINFGEIGEVCDGVVVSAYDTPPDIVRDDVARVRLSLPQGAYLSAGLRVFYPEVHGPDELVAKAAAAREGGADALHYYNYGLIPKSRLDWVRRANLQA